MEASCKTKNIKIATFVPKILVFIKYAIVLNYLPIKDKEPKLF